MVSLARPPEMVFELKVSEVLAMAIESLLAPPSNSVLVKSICGVDGVIAFTAQHGAACVGAGLSQKVVAGSKVNDVNAAEPVTVSLPESRARESSPEVLPTMRLSAVLVPRMTL